MEICMNKSAQYKFIPNSFSVYIKTGMILPVKGKTKSGLLKRHYAQFSLQNMGCTCYIFQKIAINIDK